MSELLIFAIVAFVAGFGIAWLVRTATISKLKKEHSDANSMLQNERLIKETQRKESLAIQQHQQAKEIELQQKITDAHRTLKRMDEDILLLQKNNEDTEALLKATQPEVHQLKMKLLEAQNTIARLKAKTGEK